MSSPQTQRVETIILRTIIASVGNQYSIFTFSAQESADPSYAWCQLWRLVIYFSSIQHLQTAVTGNSPKMAMRSEVFVEDIGHGRTRLRLLHLGVSLLITCKRRLICESYFVHDDSQIIITRNIFETWWESRVIQLIHVDHGSLSRPVSTRMASILSSTWSFCWLCR